MNFDINKLKEKIRVGFSDDLVSSGHFINEKTLLDWIDSLAVEVPEPKPGAIDKALKTSKALAIWYDSSEVLSEIEAAIAELTLFENMIIDLQSQNEKLDEERDDLKTELAQLQASNQQLMEKDIERDAKMKQLQADLKFEESENEGLAKNIDKAIAEIKTMKGALRTLVNDGIACNNCRAWEDSIKDWRGCVTCKHMRDLKSCKKRRIAYALANPTEEEA